MVRDREREEGPDWHLVGIALATVALSAGVALAVGRLVAGLGQDFGEVMLLSVFFGGTLVFAYVAVFSSTNTVTPDMGAGHLGGTPNTGRTADSEPAFRDRRGLSSEHFVFLVGVGLMVGGVAGLAL